MTKAEQKLAARVANQHYVQIGSKATQAAAEKLASRGLVRFYEDAEGALWIKALNRTAYEVLLSYVEDAEE